LSMDLGNSKKIGSQLKGGLRKTGRNQRVGEVSNQK
jgi:hypothetical protein